MRLLLRWFAAALAVAAAAYLVPGIRLETSLTGYLVVPLILGLVNALVRPIVRRLACGVIVVTLGLFLLVINAAMLFLAAWLARGVGIGFHIDSFVSAIVGSVVISLVSYLSSLMLDGRRGE